MGYNSNLQVGGTGILVGLRVGEVVGAVGYDIL